MELQQLVAELRGCGPALDDEAKLVAALHDAARSVGATVIEDARVRYVPHGLTVAIFLAESHAIATTWPEHRLALVDVLLCNPEMDPGAFCAVVEAALEPESVARQQLKRRIASD